MSSIEGLQHNIDGCRFGAVQVYTIMDFFSFLQLFKFAFSFNIFKQAVRPNALQTVSVLAVFKIKNKKIDENILIF